MIEVYKFCDTDTEYLPSLFFYYVFMYKCMYMNINRICLKSTHQKNINTKKADLTLKLTQSSQLEISKGST